ncbi:hypothetical protein MPEAHAMD_3982 [Methylobacterium frigidaeris]|uniref:Uncharacterized protein n=1 Tax=Methylobacterium frigidaeris TaxID=2038277 RepID=A0AA37HD70_9HYPH|nr:hypothetical protein MPEAHAMD_3982 [Methylobacterium frigidaeris]
MIGEVTVIYGGAEERSMMRRHPAMKERTRRKRAARHTATTKDHPEFNPAIRG